MQLPEIFLGMQLRGLRVDPWMRAELRAQFIQEQSEAIVRLEEFAGEKLIKTKAFSSKALMKLLYDKLGLPVQYKRKTGQPTADKEALEKLKEKVDDDQRPIFSDILTVRELGVEISTFLDAKLDDDHRIRWSTNLAGTVSGRISTSASPFWTGTNIQNWKEKVRDIIIADPGYCFVYVDGGQAEARAVAFLADDKAFKSVLNSGINFHAHMAHKVFKVDLADTHEKLEALKSTPQYKQIKTVVHAANYNVSYKKCALLIKCSDLLAIKHLEAFHSQFPGVRAKFHKEVKEQVTKTRMLTSPFGRRRLFFDRMNDELLRSAISHIPQSTISDWMDMGILRAKYFSEGVFNANHTSQLSHFFSLSEPRFCGSLDDLSRVPFIPCVQSHDGLLVLCRIEHIPETISLLKEALTYEIPFESGGLVIPVDVKIGGRWGSLIPATEDNIGRVLNGEIDIYAKGH